MRFPKEMNQEEAIKKVFERVPGLLVVNKATVVKFPKRFNNVEMCNKLSKMFNITHSIVGGLYINCMAYTNSNCVEFSFNEIEEEEQEEEELTPFEKIQEMIDEYSFSPVFSEVHTFCSFTYGIIYEYAESEGVTEENAKDWVKEYLLEGLQTEIEQEISKEHTTKALALKRRVKKAYR